MKCHTKINSKSNGYWLGSEIDAAMPILYELWRRAQFKHSGVA